MRPMADEGGGVGLEGNREVLDELLREDRLQVLLAEGEPRRPERRKGTPRTFSTSFWAFGDPGWRGGPSRPRAGGELRAMRKKAARTAPAVDGADGGRV